MSANREEVTLLDEMKGAGRTILRCHTGRSQVELVKFCDDSLAVRRDGRTLGVWEPHEADDCFRELDAQVGAAAGGRPLRTVLIGRGVLRDDGHFGGMHHLQS